MRRSSDELSGNRRPGRRFDEKIKTGKAHYRSASVSASRFMNEALSVSGSAMGEPEDWNRMLEELILEIDTARDFGFTDHEMDLARKEIVASGERAVRTESTRNAKAVMQEIFDAVDEQVPVLSAQQDLDLIHQLLPTITTAEVGAAFKKNFAPGPFAYVLLLPEKTGVSVPRLEEVLAAARAAWARRVESAKA